MEYRRRQRQMMSANDEKRSASVTDADRPTSDDDSTTRSEKSAPAWCPDDTNSPQRIITQLNLPKAGSSSDDHSQTNSGRRPFKKAATSVQRQVNVTNVFQDDSGGGRRRDGGRHLADQKLENTYKMQPDTGFSVCESEKIISQVFADHLAEAIYDRDACADLAKMLSQSIMARLKEMPSLRHKYVCHVIIGEQSCQSMQVSSRCVWNVQTDNSATARFDNQSIFAVGLVYGIYFE